MGTLATGESFLFEGFRLDRRGLFRRDEGGVLVPVAIGSRAFDVLRVLITAQGDLLAKDEIMAAVWPGTVVEDNNLTVQISALRQDSALFPFIEQLGRAAGFARDDTPATKLDKLEALLARTAPSDEDVALLVDLLSLPASERHPMPNLSPQRTSAMRCHARAL